MNPNWVRYFTTTVRNLFDPKNIPANVGYAEDYLTSVTMKTKKIIKRALKHPELYTEAELAYMKLVKQERKRLKLVRKENQPVE